MVRRRGSFVLYGSPGSGSAAVEAALVRCRLPFEQVRASSWERGSAIDALAKVNPLRQIPTLVLPDGSVLTESAAILMHLGLSYPRSGLLPRDPAARAQALRALVFIAANCYSAIGVIDYPQRWCVAADAAVRERIRLGARRRLHAHWRLFADQFGAQRFLAEGAPSAPALLAAVVSRWSGTRRMLQRQRANFHARLEQIERHPTVAAVFERHWPATGA